MITSYNVDQCRVLHATFSLKTNKLDIIMSRFEINICSTNDTVLIFQIIIVSVNVIVYPASFNWMDINLNSTK